MSPATLEKKIKLIAQSDAMYAIFQGLLDENSDGEPYWTGPESMEIPQHIVGEITKMTGRASKYYLAIYRQSFADAIETHRGE